RIIRRAARHSNKLGATDAFFYKLVAPLVTEMGDAYPELREAQDKVEDALRFEEERFSETLAAGMKILNEAVANLTGETIPGDVLFKLYDTYGFPVDLTADIARERDLEVDLDGFESAMDAQRQRARANQQFDAGGLARVDIDKASEFLGYEYLHASADVIGLFVEGKAVEEMSSGQSGTLVLNRTPFYAESGGQVGDVGALSHSGGHFRVEDTQKQGEVFLHLGEVESGVLKVGDTLGAQVAADVRQATVLNHSATHLLHAALRNTLGSHVEQKGSLVAPGYLRFDFSHPQPVDSATLESMEQWVNDVVRCNVETQTRTMSMDAAIDAGAIALFGEKYGDEVRVVSMGDTSVELCGGTHVARTGDIGLFRITGETGIAAGVRRIEAVTGEYALARSLDESRALSELTELARTSRDNLSAKVQQILERNKSLEKDVQRLQQQLARGGSSDLASQAHDVGGIKVLAVTVEGSPDARVLRDTADRLSDKMPNSAIVLASAADSKVSLVARVSKSLTDRLKACDLFNSVAQQIGGKGGGRPDMAQAGGNQPENLPAALASVDEWVKQRISES
ncbi:MAG: alanine--tRNA ligase, partial [Pseudomonadota bacterium]